VTADELGGQKTRRVPDAVSSVDADHRLDHHGGAWCKTVAMSTSCGPDLDGPGRSVVDRTAIRVIGHVALRSGQAVRTS